MVDMKHSTASAATLRARVAAQFADPTPMRRGSLTERRVKCSRPGCPRRQSRDARHGPYFSWTRTVAGTTHTRLIPAAQVETVRRQIAAGREFRDATELYWAACEHLADTALAQEVTAAAGREKGGSARRSRRILRKRSRAS